VADQAANMKKAFAAEPEGTEKNTQPEDYYLQFAHNLLFKQKRAELEEQKKIQEALAVQETEKQIEEMNAKSSTVNNDFNNYKRDQVKIKFLFF
jgi:hypothetical protein